MWGHWGNEGQVWGLLVEAEWVTVAGGWLQCAGASVMDQGLYSSYECWSPDWPSSVGPHFQAVPQFLGPQACPASDGPLQRTLQIQCLGDPALHQDGTFFVQYPQARKESKHSVVYSQKINYSAFTSKIKIIF